MHPWVLPRAGSVGEPLLGRSCPGGDAAAGGTPVSLGATSFGWRWHLGTFPGGSTRVGTAGNRTGLGVPILAAPMAGGVPSSTPPAAAR